MAFRARKTGGSLTVSASPADIISRALALIACVSDRRQGFGCPFFEDRIARGRWGRFRGVHPVVQVKDDLTGDRMSNLSSVIMPSLFFHASVSYNSASRRCRSRLYPDGAPPRHVKEGRRRRLAEQYICPDTVMVSIMSVAIHVSSRWHVWRNRVGGD